MSDLLGADIPKFYGNEGTSQGMPSNYGLLIDAHQDSNYGFDFYVSLATGNIPDKIWIRSDIMNVKSSWVNLSDLIS